MLSRARGAPWRSRVGDGDSLTELLLFVEDSEETESRGRRRKKRDGAAPLVPPRAGRGSDYDEGGAGFPFPLAERLEGGRGGGAKASKARPWRLLFRFSEKFRDNKRKQKKRKKERGETAAAGRKRGGA